MVQELLRGGKTFCCLDDGTVYEGERRWRGSQSLSNLMELTEVEMAPPR